MERFIISTAPLQGFTTHLWRRAHHAVMGGVDDYTTPFIRVERGTVRRRDLADAAPEANRDVPVVPQILACEPAEALMMVRELTGHSSEPVVYITPSREVPGYPMATPKRIEYPSESFPKTREDLQFYKNLNDDFKFWFYIHRYSFTY